MPEEAKVSVFDRGFLYGDSVYETIGTSYGRLFAARDHLDRLDRSASASACACRRARNRARDRGDRRRGRQPGVARARHPDARQGKLDLDPASATDSRLVVIVFPLGPPTPEMFENGVAVAIVSITRNSPQRDRPGGEIRQLPGQRAGAGGGAAAQGAYEAILCAGDGSIAEGSTSNVFAVIGGEVRTPPPRSASWTASRAPR